MINNIQTNKIKYYPINSNKHTGKYFERARELELELENVIFQGL